jgi:hypothetical protein
MKFGILRERKSPPAEELFSPDELLRIKSVIRMPSYKLKVHIRIFTDAQYSDLELKFQMTSVIVIFIWVKEVPVDFLIPDKSYFFFLIR